MTAQTDLNKIKRIFDNTDEHRNRDRRDSWEKIKEILGLSEPDPEPPAPEPEPTPAVVEPAPAPAPEVETPAKPAGT